MTGIAPAERRELRAVVRAQLKVLRAEVAQREAELHAESERQLMERYREEDKLVEDINFRIRQIVQQANIEIGDLLRSAGENIEGGRWRGMGFIVLPTYRRQNEDRKQLHMALDAGIKAQVRNALLALDRQEADLLKQLAMEGIESDEAQAFLARIPTVAELVPSKRLREIEAAFDERKAATS